MATVSKTFAFAADAEGFAAAQATAGITLAWDGSVGNPPGSLRANTTSKGVAATENYWEWSGTWESLGVPPNSTVTGIQVTSCSTRAVARSAHANTTLIGPYSLNADDGTLRGTLWAGRSASTQEASWNVIGAQPAVTFAAEPSSTPVRIRLADTIGTGGGGGQANVSLHDDQVALLITYTAPVTGPPPFTGWGIPL